MCLGSVLTTRTDDEIQGEWKWWGSVRGKDDCIYGIPTNARRVVKFNPVDKSMTEIGPDLGNAEWKWRDGVLADNGSIYCAPLNSNQVLKIDTINGTVTTLDAQVPQNGNFMWSTGALAMDKCIYFMPAHAHRILKVNPEDDSVNTVGDDLGEGFKYSGAVAVNDGSIFGIPHESSTVIRFDPVTELISSVGEEAEEELLCCTGVLVNGYIYAASHENHGLIKIDVVNNTYSFVRHSYLVQSQTHEYDGWGSAIFGDDGCIYWPPYCSDHILKFDTLTQICSLVGSDFGDTCDKWCGGAVTSNGVIYCIPCSATQILVIDPFKEFTIMLKDDIEQHPEDLGRLFAKNEQGMTTFESALIKYGSDRVFKAIEDCVPDHIPCGGINLQPFMVAALCENSAVSVIYHFLRSNPNALFTNHDDINCEGGMVWDHDASS
jgi:hypothetical protein